MASDLPAALQGHFFPPTAEQKAKGWSQNWPQYWEPHDKLLASGGHPPTAEQAAKGWTQNWEAWKIAADEPRGEDGSGGVLIRVDFTGGATVRAAKQQMSKETHEFQLQQLKGAPPLLRPQLCDRVEPTPANSCSRSAVLQSCARPSPSASRRWRSSRRCS